MTITHSHSTSHKPYRGAKIRQEIEEILHRLIVDILTAYTEPGWLWWHTPNGEGRSKSAAGRLKAMGVKAGISDLLILSPEGKLHAFELKARGKRPNQTQADYMAAVIKAGGEADWADNFDDAIAILRGWGVVVKVRI